MPDLAPHRSATTIGVILGDGAPLLELAVAPRVFSVDVTDAGGPAFDLRLAAERPGRLGTTGGLGLEAPCTLADLDAAGVVIVPGWRAGSTDPAPEVLDTLRRAHREGAVVVGLCLGSFVLAAAGLLDGLRATTHWAALDELRRRHPAVRAEPDALYVDEGPILTSAGSAAGLDACLHLLRREHGARVANHVARRLVVAPHRSGGQAQFVERPVATAPDDGIGRAMRAAQERLADPDLDVAALAAVAGMSRRTFDRRFRTAAGVSALRWLVDQRVLRAQELLAGSELDVDAVARRCGFSDATALRPHFRRVVGVAPRSYRSTFATAAG